MKVVIQYEENTLNLISIAKVLSLLDHEIIFWNSNIETINEISTKHRPHLFIVKDKLKPAEWEMIKNFRYIIYGQEDLNNEAIFKISPDIAFFDPISYSNEFGNYKFENDITISSNMAEESEVITELAHFIFINTNYTFRILGNVTIPNIYFAGTCMLEEYMKYAKSTKINITTQKTEEISLNCRDCFAILNSQQNWQFIDMMVSDEKSRRNYSLEIKEEFLDNNKTSLHFVDNMLKTCGIKTNDINKVLGSVI